VSLFEQLVGYVTSLMHRVVKLPVMLVVSCR